ncbi:MAG TPA: spore coat protein [Desulfotomaculum sp.]|nr:MAG: coat protein F [Peptococcaceae bacterium BRH_c8a]KJS71810.1 MAG: coat protein F [Desulfotomaculum sp. BICA1-6]HBX23022.1 spore coat protein [Desulfotomaculum sp.]
MAFNLSQKENMLLQDQKKHEELCVQKYQTYAQQAQDPQLKQLFNSLAQQEQQHLNTVNQLLSGQVPKLQQSQQSQSQGQNQYTQATAQNKTPGTVNQNDIGLCNDMLITEKYISNTYDNTIFECTNTNARQVLNHIQKEEQQHGEAIFNYLQSQGKYNVQ